MNGEGEEDTAALIKQIATKHGIAIGRDDPILLMQTVNHFLLSRSAAKQEELLEAFRASLETSAMTWSEDAKKKAERVLGAALAASRDMMEQAMRESAQEVMAIVRREVESSASGIRKAARAAWLPACLNLMATAAALAALFLGASNL